MDNRISDYVIVGGGTAGCVLAARLTEDPSVSVTLIEAGPENRGLLVQMPAGLGALYDKGALHWPFKAEAEPYAADKVLPYKMGRVLGGSSAINGLVWARGNPRDFDDWAEAGCTGWSWADIEPIFRRIEDFKDENDPHMGHDGPIPVKRGRAECNVLANAFLAAAAEAGHRINPNHNSGDQDGFCALHQNTRDGRRGDVYEGYLRPVRSRPNLRIHTGQPVLRVLLDGSRAIGVEVGTRTGTVVHRARRDVILAAGAVASPQLLELSGIGDPAVLSRAGVALRHNLPGVGENFHTHPTIALTYRCSKPVSILNATRGAGKIAAGLRWILTRTGPAATNHFEAGAFLRAFPDSDRPDYQITFLPLALGGTTGAVMLHGYQIYIELVGCRSRGYCHVASASVEDQPRFRFNFLQDPRDIEVYKRAVETARTLAAQPALAALTEAELVPGREIQGAAEVEAWIRRCASISHHLVGSCRMGPSGDPMAVVGPDLRVHGLDGLRVVDASIMPRVTSANTHATTIAIAEKAADMIRVAHETSQPRIRA
ncbi:GMC family oxidoreductase [Defluviimonas salinarum]|uniref:GMC family oxidoreductase N-terminal domain-containing protein n=1 Tax=Defluviimonas salinarum TaxID=2992147 RepID=A0ABT3J348_9RHOB|nr:GMC family oxidoreductase N-terminal domain-containing protein [Defluviimonas salinarum]MCW3782099.1 GMC family oxidoreductase N-terminal domain-containing protein [Defluviimonas salinarum]